MSTVNWKSIERYEFRRCKQIEMNLLDSCLLFSSFDDAKPVEILCGIESSDEHRLSSIHNFKKNIYFDCEDLVCFFLS